MNEKKGLHLDQTPESCPSLGSPLKKYFRKNMENQFTSILLRKGVNRYRESIKCLPNFMTLEFVVI
jgi:hypothetical protein